MFESTTCREPISQEARDLMTKALLERDKERGRAAWLADREKYEKLSRKRSLIKRILLGVLMAVLTAGVASAADYRLVDRSGNVVMALEHGTTIDLHDLADRSYLKVEASFEDLGHATWVDFTLIHSGRSFDYKRTDRSPENGWWQVCPGRCYALRRAGSVMLKSKVWWGDDHPLPRRQASSGRTLLLSESRTASRLSSPRRPAKPGSPPATAIPMCAKRLWALRCGRL